MLFRSEDRGHTVIGPSASVSAALRLLETERPDVTLMDVNLRGQLVTPVAKRLKSLDIPFVVCSAYHSVDFDDSEILTAAPKLPKPIEERRMMEALNRAVG